MLKDKILEVYKGTIHRRFDDVLAYYFNSKDFPGLKETVYEFVSCKGDTLRGNFYYYDGYKENHIIVFDHGMGAGHNAYFREIELLAKNGYKVYSYDHTGCMNSDGEHANGFLTSLADLDSCLTALKKDFPGNKISVIGHSWGAFSTSNIAAFHADVAHVISLAPFNSLSSILHQTFHGLLGFMYKHVYEFEASIYPKYAKSSTIEALRNYQGHALIIHSKDDNVLNVKYHFNEIKKALNNKENIEFVLVNKKLHNPNYTVEAVCYLTKYIKLRNKLFREKKLETLEQRESFIKMFDWCKMTEQDSEVWNKILDVLNK